MKGSDIGTFCTVKKAIILLERFSESGWIHRKGRLIKVCINYVRT